MEFAALLHDYASIKDEALYADHHIHSPIEAEKLLTRFGYPAEKIEAVKEGDRDTPGECHSGTSECGGSMSREC